MNNINIEQLQQFFSNVQDEPAQAKKTKQVMGAWVFEKGNPQFVSTVEYPQGSATLKTELPFFAGGWGAVLIPSNTACTAWPHALLQHL